MCEYFKSMKNVSRSVHKIMVATLHPNVFTFLSSRVKVTTKSLYSTMLSLYNFIHRSLPKSLPRMDLFLDLVAINPFPLLFQTA